MNKIFDLIDDDLPLEENAINDYRNASRAIITKNGKILMTYSNKYKDYKLPGGGIKPNESPIEALIREVKEETGYNIIPSSIKEFGVITERKKGFTDNRILNMENYYFTCSVNEQVDSLNLDDYEKEGEYNPVFVLIKEAIDNNKSVISVKPWVKREILFLEYLILDKPINKKRMGGIIIDNNSLLVIERFLNELYYTIPGGHKENFDINSKETLKREMIEEVGLEVSVGKKIMSISYNNELQEYYLCNITGGKLGKGTGLEYNEDYIKIHGTYNPLYLPFNELLNKKFRPRDLIEIIYELSKNNFNKNELSFIDLGNDIMIEL